jgi:hypothetical protein
MELFQEKQEINRQTTTGIRLFLFLLGGILVSCTPDSHMYEVTNTSSAHSKKDGVFLKSYHLSPASVYLPIKEVFVEQRLMAGANPTRQHRLDSTTVAANLIVVLEKPLQLGLLHFDWNLLLADGVTWADRREATSCDEPTALLLRFRLKDRPVFDNPAFPMRLQLMKDSATNVAKTIDFTATPL